jgi:hypothetical protein
VRTSADLCVCAARARYRSGLGELLSVDSAFAVVIVAEYEVPVQPFHDIRNGSSISRYGYGATLQLTDARLHLSNLFPPLTQTLMGIVSDNSLQSLLPVEVVQGSFQLLLQPNNFFVNLGEFVHGAFVVVGE